MRYTRDYALLAAKTPEVVHVFLKPDNIKEIKNWANNLDKADLKDAPRIFQDPNANLAKKYAIPDGYKFHGQSVHFPALIVLDGQGKEVFRYVGKSNSDRLPIADFTKS